MSRTLAQALKNAERLRREIPHLIQPETTTFDMVILAEHIAALNILVEAQKKRVYKQASKVGKQAEHIAALEAEVVNRKEAFEAQWKLHNEHARGWCERIATLKAELENHIGISNGLATDCERYVARIAALEAQELGFVATLSCMETEAERLRNRIAEMDAQAAKIQQLLTATWPETTTTAMTSQTHGELSRARSKGTWFRD